MMRKYIFLTVFLTGCASTPMPVIVKPMPAPAPTQKCINVPGEGCKKITAGNVGGTTLGYHDDEDLPAKAAPATIKP